MAYFSRQNDINHLIDLIAMPAVFYEWIGPFGGGPEVLTIGYGFGLSNWFIRSRISFWFFNGNTETSVGISAGYILNNRR